jgi:hypothetical protein
MAGISIVGRQQMKLIAGSNGSLEVGSGRGLNSDVRIAGTCRHTTNLAFALYASNSSCAPEPGFQAKALKHRQF